MEADGSFNGQCIMVDTSGRLFPSGLCLELVTREKLTEPVCLGDEFTTPKGKVLCCLGGTVMAVDSSTNEAACCPSGKVYRNWACSDPTPEINCPGSNGQWVNK